MTQLSPPPELRPPGSAPKSGTTVAPAASTQIFLIWILAVGLLVLLLVVLFVLPTRMQSTGSSSDARLDTENNTTTAAPPITTPPVAEPPATAVNISTTDDSRTSAPRETAQASANHQAVKPQADNSVVQQQAGEALQAYLRLSAQPDLSKAEIWANAIWTEAADSADQGDRLYGQRRFADALGNYQAALQQLQELQASRSQILNETLAQAQQALDNNDIDAAIPAFERVLAMQENHPLARTGLQRAQVRQQVLDLIAAGEQATTENQPDKAAKAYQSALKLDPDFTAAQQALNVVQETLDRRAFQAAMSMALNEITAGNFKAAEQALTKAAAIDASSSAVVDARQRLQQARKQARLKQLRQQASASAKKEQWRKAADLYRKALKMEPKTGFARSGIMRAEGRIELHKQLDHYLDQPQRLSADEPLNNAKTLLAANPAPPEDEPLLLAKIARLKQAVETASTPVELLLESDGLTNITIYHVGRLGTFTQKRLELRPGQYTVTGSRSGYRDVRKIITLAPDKPVTLQLISEERF